MSEKNCLVLHRKSANRPEVKHAVKAVIKSGIPLRVRIPWNKRDKDLVVREAIQSGAERIIAGGGDGTINALVNSLVGIGKKPPQTVMGILPLGTANDFARGCELPVDDLEECLRVACTAPARPVDVGRMNKQCFINVASLGFGAEVTAMTPQQLKKLLGGGAYTLMGLATALKFKPYSGQLSIPGRPLIEGEMLVAAVGNCRFAGGGFEVAPQASLTDGLLDFAVISHDTEFSLSTVLRELDNPFNEGNRYVRYWQVPEFTIVSDDTLHCNLDGEPIQKRKMKFSVLPRHLCVAMPQSFSM
jgi:lipid kinase YegS